MTGSVLFPQRALRGSTIGDNGSVAVEVIYYLRRADFVFGFFFRMNSTLVGGKRNCTARRSR